MLSLSFKLRGFIKIWRYITTRQSFALNDCLSSGFIYSKNLEGVFLFFRWFQKTPNLTFQFLNDSTGLYLVVNLLYSHSWRCLLQSIPDLSQCCEADFHYQGKDLLWFSRSFDVSELTSTFFLFKNVPAHWLGHS